ncbi:PilZ domain-containing protein [Sporosarcina cyprini]|uniref:PilZ domain-containing protein n=1 Tax=Sporosarcina cyprini TaxID=2910523 RepID=UPI001EDF5BEE|nr:PilZ domain-containing protein [Sporosarcina cyprini]MCG3089622.1 PilZ domain-containing protein [Sporosarcina cyprini]
MERVDMQYKRTEYFRHTFDEPIEAEFRLLVGEHHSKASSPGGCQLMDISSGGAKLYTEYDIPIELHEVDLRLRFTLYEQPIEQEGKIVWKKRYQNGYQYGFDFLEQPLNARLIVDELKLRVKSGRK